MDKQIKRIATISLDKDTLFGKLGQTIEYLSTIQRQYKNGETLWLNEEWSGYEDNYFEVIVERVETDVECLAREIEEKAEIEREERRETRRKEAEDCKRRREIQKKIDDLKKQL